MIKKQSKTKKGMERRNQQEVELYSFTHTADP